MSNDSLLELKGKKSDDLTIVIIELISDIIDEIDRLKEEKERKKNDVPIHKLIIFRFFFVELVLSDYFITSVSFHNNRQWYGITE